MTFTSSHHFDFFQLLPWKSILSKCHCKGSTDQVMEFLWVTDIECYKVAIYRKCLCFLNKTVSPEVVPCSC